MVSKIIQLLIIELIMLFFASAGIVTVLSDMFSVPFKYEYTIVIMIVIFAITMLKGLYGAPNEEQEN